MRHTRMIAVLAADQPGSAESDRIPETARLRVLLFSLSLALGARHAVAQGMIQDVPVSAACIELSQTVLSQAAGGRFEEAENALSSTLDNVSNRPQHSCAGLVLHKLSVLMAVSGRSAEAEQFAERSVKILVENFPPDDPVLLRPLQVLAATRFEQRKTAKAREAFNRMRSIRIVSPEDYALVHEMAAALLHAEGRWREAESEYLRTISAWEEAGRGDTPDAGALFSALGSLYIEERRLDDAQRALAHAATIFDSAKNAVPMDRIKLLNLRALLYAQRGEWGKAERDLQEAVSMVDREARVNPVALALMLANYAHVLRKNHHRPDARSVEARAAALPVNRTTVVDVAELLGNTKRTKK
jgi:tetratricopeptide (TPR) repeat protein